jgi:hypothetical protein
MKEIPIMRTTPSTASMTTRVFAWISAFAIVLAAGAVYGHYSNRWGPPTDLVAAGEHLKTLPPEIGDWHLQDESTMSAGTIEMLECAGYVSRSYVNVRTGDTINVALIVGPPGPISVHTPEICYSSRNYELIGRREATRLASHSGQAHTFWNTTFKSKNAFSEKLSVYYAWSDGSAWSAARSPRFTFAASPALYKLQLAGVIGEGRNSETKTPPARFLKALIDSNWNLK